MGRLKDKWAVEPLIATLKDPNPVVQKWVIHALGDIGDNRIVDPLVSCLPGEHGGMAAEALGKIGDGRAFDPILPLLENPEYEPRAYAVEAIGRLGDERASTF